MNRRKSHGYPPKHFGFGTIPKGVDGPRPKIECSNFPFISIDTYVKQVNVSELNDIGKAALTHAFQGFLGDTSEEESFNKLQFISKMKKIADESGSSYTWDAATSRRFAGDMSLLRGRYFTLCDEIGYDSGTLVRELRAYYNPKAAGLIQIYDLTRGDDYKTACSLGFDFMKPHHLMIIFLPLGDTPNPFVQHVSHLVPKEADALRTGISVFLDLVIRRFETKRAIDLRKPEVATWFAKTMSRIEWNLEGNKLPCFPERQPIDSFPEILPEVISQELGGGGFSKAVGLFLRYLGAEALIYPSARTDSGIEVKDGKTVAAWGWNLVNYSDSPLPIYSTWVEQGDQWPAGIGLRPGPEAPPEQHAIWFHDVEIEQHDIGSRAGSWRVNGLRKRRDAYWRLHMTEYLIDVMKSTVSGSSYDELMALLSRHLAHDNIEYVGRISKVITDAIAGDPNAQAALIAMANDCRVGGNSTLALALEDIANNASIKAG